MNNEPEIPVDTLVQIKELYEKHPSLQGSKEGTVIQSHRVGTTTIYTILLNSGRYISVTAGVIKSF